MAQTNKRKKMELDDVNNDCMLHALSFLNTTDLDAVAVCNRRFYEARDSDLLDPPMAIIEFPERRRITYLADTIILSNVPRYWQTRSHLVIDGVDNAIHENVGAVSEEEGTRLLNLQLRRPLESLTLLAWLTMDNFHYDRDKDYAYESLLHAVSILAVYATDVLIDMPAYPCEVVTFICQNFFRLQRFTWVGSGRHECFAEHRLDMDSTQFEDAHDLTRLTLDSAIFIDHEILNPYYWEEDDVEPETNQNWYWLQKCRGIQYLSVKNASWCFRYFFDGHGWEEGDDFEGWVEGDDFEWRTQPIPQQVIMKLVRMTPTLRWLRSDLTQENVAALRTEWPNITFVMNE